MNEFSQGFLEKLKTRKTIGLFLSIICSQDISIRVFVKSQRQCMEMVSDGCILLWCKGGNIWNIKSVISSVKDEALRAFSNKRKVG